MLAGYARNAISIIIHDAVETFQFTEWKGDKKFTIDPPTTALEWARDTKRWFGSTLTCDINNINLDTSAFENKIKINMVEKKRLDGNGEKSQE